MKYLILVPDGAADHQLDSLNGKTPLEVADMPVINKLAQKSMIGLVRTIPDGIAPGSDAANLSVMGYDPSVYLTGRSPLEAASIGIEMSDTDVAFRTNLITLQGNGDYEDLIILDHSAGDISTEEANQLIEAVNKSFGNEDRHFYTGTSYRHCLIVHNGSTDYDLTPPHDQLDKKTGPYLPKGPGSDEIIHMMKRSYELLKDHPVNQKRIAAGKNPANSIWIWGQGKKPALSSFGEKYGITGAAISAVDLIKGIAKCAGLDSIDVPGATGTLHTNFAGKAKAAIEVYKSGKDFVYLHLEAPDECSHQGDLEGKIASLERIDKEVLAPILEYFRESGEAFSILELPDHRTPIALRTHTSEPVPFILYRSNAEQPENPDNKFTEEAGKHGIYFDSGFALADTFFGWRD
jgi:2,3-bisphosphoglycerate-independent phosphoglycerate mutase